MGTTRLARPQFNWVTNGNSTLKNGTGGSPTPPPLTQDADYPMGNLQHADRHTVWSTGGSAPATILVHYDLGSDRAVKLVGFLGLNRALATDAFPSTVDVGSRTAAQGYSATEGDYATASSVAATNRVDNVAVVNVTARYWQFAFKLVPSSGFTLGKVVLHSSGLDDLGIAYAPGAERHIIRPRAATRTPGGALAATNLGNNYNAFVLPFRSVTSTELAMLQALTLVTEPFIYIDSYADEVWECIARPEFARVHRWGPSPNLFDVTLEFEGLQ